MFERHFSGENFTPGTQKLFQFNCFANLDYREEFDAEDFVKSYSRRCLKPLPRQIIGVVLMGKSLWKKMQLSEPKFTDPNPIRKIAVIFTFGNIRSFDFYIYYNNIEPFSIQYYRSISGHQTKMYSRRDQG